MSIINRIVTLKAINIIDGERSVKVRDVVIPTRCHSATLEMLVIHSVRHFKPVVSPALGVEAPDAALPPPCQPGLGLASGVDCCHHAPQPRTGPVR